MQSRQQNATFVSWLIKKKSGKTPLETIPLYISLAGGHVNGAEIPVGYQYEAGTAWKAREANH